MARRGSSDNFVVGPLVYFDEDINFDYGVLGARMLAPMLAGMQGVTTATVESVDTAARTITISTQNQGVGMATNQDHNRHEQWWLDHHLSQQRERTQAEIRYRRAQDALASHGVQMQLTISRPSGNVFWLGLLDHIVRQRGLFDVAYDAANAPFYTDNPREMHFDVGRYPPPSDVIGVSLSGYLVMRIQEYLIRYGRFQQYRRLMMGDRGDQERAALRSLHRLFGQLGLPAELMETIDHMGESMYSSFVNSEHVPDSHLALRMPVERYGTTTGRLTSSELRMQNFASAITSQMGQMTAHMRTSVANDLWGVEARSYAEFKKLYEDRRFTQTVPVIPHKSKEVQIFDDQMAVALEEFAKERRA